MEYFLSNQQMVNEKLNTITHTMWSLNTIGPNTVQKPHRHNSIAIDLCSDMNDLSEGLVYTLMSKEIDDNGNLINPIRMNWKNIIHLYTPGWMRIHIIMNQIMHVFMLQDAGFHTYMRTLDIQFIK